MANLSRLYIMFDSHGILLKRSKAMKLAWEYYTGTSKENIVTQIEIFGTYQDYELCEKEPVEPKRKVAYFLIKDDKFVEVLYYV